MHALIFSCLTACLLTSTLMVSTFHGGVKGNPLPTENVRDTTNSSDTTVPDTSSVTSPGGPTDTDSTDSTSTGTMSTSNSSDITTPVSFITSSELPGSTSSGSTSSPASSPNTYPSIEPPNTTAATTAGFDGASFGGGIALGVGLILITFIAYRCYVLRLNKSQKYSAM